MADPLLKPKHRRAPAGTTTPKGAGRSRSRPVAVFNWLFRSRQNGRVTVVQLPNIPLWIYLPTVVLRCVSSRLVRGSARLSAGSGSSP